MKEDGSFIWRRVSIFQRAIVFLPLSVTHIQPDTYIKA